jgi:hypothetical protein
LAVLRFGELPCWQDVLWQDGVITRAQLAAVRVTDSSLRARLAGGRWQRLLPGIYLTHGGPVEYRARVWAAVLYAGSGAAASHRTAAFLSGLVDQEPNDVHVLIPHARRVRPQPRLSVHRATASALIGNQRPPRTSVEWTVLDLTDDLRRDDDVVGIVTAAFVRGLTTVARLSAAAESRSRLRWRSLIKELLCDDEAGLESPLEWRYRRDVQRPHALPRADPQSWVRDVGKAARRDAYYKAYLLVVELDGRLGHVGEGAFRDAARDNAAVVRGEVTLRFGWSDVVGRPCMVAAQISAVLTARGWTGTPRACGAACPVGRA